tara:strand:- start:155 stop:400 length:246 start_codon:yes stop_codon:yes gene_type:complete
VIQGREAHHEHWWEIPDPHFDFIPILKDDEHFGGLMYGNDMRAHYDRNNLADFDCDCIKSKNFSGLIEICAVNPKSDGTMI